MDGPENTKPHSSFRHFFFRGLAILLPSVLTIWILFAGYQFVRGYIAQPINQGIKILTVHLTPWPPVDTSEAALIEYEQELSSEARKSYRAVDDGAKDAWLINWAQRQELERWWNSYSPFMDLIGLVVAIVLIYMAGLVLGSFIGRRLYQRGEDLLQRLPLIRRVYPAVKQVTDFFVGDQQAQISFNRVVAVQYPRKGIWSIGLVTGDTMRTIQAAAGKDCLTIFIPSSPTPFTGYVITVPRSDTIDLPINIEEAIKFTVSGGVLIPPVEMIGDRPTAEEESPAATEPSATVGGRPAPPGA